jgi:hypothetical protein
LVGFDCNVNLVRWEVSKCTEHRPFVINYYYAVDLCSTKLPIGCKLGCWLDHSQPRFWPAWCIWPGKENDIIPLVTFFFPLAGALRRFW